MTDYIISATIYLCKLAEVHFNQRLNVKYLKIISYLRTVSISSCSPFGEIHLRWDCTCSFKFLHLHLYKFPVKCASWWCYCSPAPSPHLLSQPVSSLSVWEREWFVTAIWEINKCFHCLFCHSTGTGWGGMRSLNYTDNITSTMTRVHIVKFPE